MAKGKQINLDLGEGQILQGYITDDLFSCCTFLDITFECSEKLTFEPSIEYYLTYYEVDWIATGINESTGVNNNWHYELTCCPKSVFTLITKPINNTQELARAMRLDLTKNSSSLKVPCPVINQHAGNFIQDSRFFSLEQAKVKDPNNLGEAVYMYVGTKELLSVSWRNLITQTATTMEFVPELAGSNKIIYQNDEVETVFATAHGPKVWNQKDYLGKMIGKKFAIETAVPASFLSVYTMKFEDIPEFDTGVSYLCAYSQIDVMKGNSFIHQFVNIKGVK